MSVEKFNAEAETAGESAKIRFSYETDKIFNSVSLRTTYRANMTKNQEGESQLDDIAISQDERDIMIEFLADGVYEIAAELFKITEGINLSVFVNKAIVSSDGLGASGADATPAPATTTPVAPEVGDAYTVTTTAWGGFAVGDVVIYTASGFIRLNQTASGFEIKDNSVFNANLLPSLDKKIEACIRYYIMREWYGSTGMQNDMVLNASLYKANVIKVKNLTFQLRKPLMT